MRFQTVYDRWKSDPEGYWLQAAEAIDWFKKPEQALFDDNAPIFSWFNDSEVNACWNAVDRHVRNGRGGQVALIYDSPVTGKKRQVTYDNLLHSVSRLAGALQARGVRAGDRVVIYMPMIPEAIMAMLACARIGAVHSVVFGGFAAPELAVRISHSKAKCVLSASCGVEPSRIVEYKPLLDEAIQLSEHKPEFCVVLDRELSPLRMGRDIEWNRFLEAAEPVDCVPLPGNHPAYILYTSGTTGAPKGVVRPTAGHIVALQWTMKNIYGLDPGEVFWTASDVGWVVGHSYICYAPLLSANPSLVYEGKPVGTPDASAFWRVIAEHRVRALFTAPTAFRAIKREDPNGELPGKFDLSDFRTLFLAGERADPDTIAWAERHLKVPVIDHWWQTETGWSIAANPVGIELLPVKPGSPTVAMPGYDVRILNDEGKECAPGELGNIVVRLPLPPGTLHTLWEADQRFCESYLAEFPGHYNTGDAGYMDEDGYLYIMARTDDVINVAGHRLSTGAFEEVIAGHPDVAECAVVGIRDELKGQLPLGFICLNAGSSINHGELVEECVSLVRRKIGPVAAFRQALVVDRLPKTRSGKILRGVMAKIADGVEFDCPATIDDAAVIDEIQSTLQSAGYPKS
ncbi:MAG: propionyl-CoA synthetase [Rhodobacteraceae bacterium]|nr:propionyl-CoA synthetase [Paracoccaceae bacterium]